MEPAELPEVMREWCDGYRFATAAENDLYNTDMVLYHLKHAILNEAGPDDLVDRNVSAGKWCIAMP